MRTPYTRPYHRFARILSVLMLLVSTLAMLLIVPSTLVTAQEADQPDWETPPMYYRPSENNLVAGDNDPINIVIYGPGFLVTDVNQALFSAGALPDPRNEGAAWFDNNGTWDPDEFQGPLYLVALVQRYFNGEQNCTNPITWSPVDNEPGEVHIGAAATTLCPAIAYDPDSSTFPLFRNHTRYWDFTAEDYTSRTFPDPNSATIYVAASYEENVVRLEDPYPTFPNYYEPLPNAGFLPCGSAHCLESYQRGRAFFVRDLIKGAQALSWTVKEQDKITNLPIHVNQQDGPYGPFRTDGNTRVICINKDDITLPDGTNYCDLKPAERPLALNSLDPAVGSQLNAGEEQVFSVDVGYSDGRRTIQSADFILDYSTSDGRENTISAPATISPPRTDGEYGFIYTANTTLAIPADATGAAKLRIHVCDSEGACWTRNNLNYTIQRSSGDINVPANQEWTSTGVQVEVGDTITGTATGTWCFNGGSGCFGPDGDATASGGFCNDPYPLDGPRYYNLIMRSGNNIQALGSSFQVTVQEAGTLHFGYNDCYYPNNTGSVDVMFTVNGG